MGQDTIAIPYGKGRVMLTVPTETLLDVLLPRSFRAPADADTLVRRALANPTGSPGLRDIVRQHGLGAAGRTGRVVILVSDITRPVPTRLILPPVLGELEAAGIDRGDIRIVVATGLHRGHTREEKRLLVGDAVADDYAVEDHSPDNCIPCGTTSSGIPVEVNRTVAESDLRICTGNIDPHYFAGYTGGAKAVMPGVSSRASVVATHRMMFLPGAEVGRVEGNPVRAAIDEIGVSLGIHFILNVIVNEKKEVIGAVSGHHVTAHREGCRIADQVFKVPMREPADIVVAGAGGFPKDINLYQAQKGLDNARLAVKQGGVIVLVAECTEGFGDATFQDWMTGAKDPEMIIARMQRQFVMGGHKAAAVALTMRRARVILVSSLDPGLVRRALFTPARDVSEAMDAALAARGGPAKVAVIPSAGSVIMGSET